MGDRSRLSARHSYLLMPLDAVESLLFGPLGLQVPRGRLEGLALRRQFRGARRELLGERQRSRDASGASRIHPP